MLIGGLGKNIGLNPYIFNFGIYNDLHGDVLERATYHYLILISQECKF